MEKIAAPPLIPAALALGGKALAWLGAGSKLMGLFNAGMYGSTAWDALKGLKSAFAKAPRPPMGMPQQGVLSSYSRYGPHGFAHMAELQERFLAFQSGIDRFCKEAGFDEEDREALYALVKKAMAPGGVYDPWDPANKDLGESSMYTPKAVKSVVEPSGFFSSMGRLGREMGHAGKLPEREDPTARLGGWGHVGRQLGAIPTKPLTWFAKMVNPEEYEAGERYHKAQEVSAREANMPVLESHKRYRSQRLADEATAAEERTALMPNEMKNVRDQAGGNPERQLSLYGTKLKMEGSPQLEVAKYIESKSPGFIANTPGMADYIKKETAREAQ